MDHKINFKPDLKYPGTNISGGLSIFQKLLFWFVGLSIFITFTSGFIHYFYAEKIIEASVRKELENSLNVAISYFDNRYANAIHDSLNSLELNDVDQELNHVIKANRSYISISLLTSDGEIKIISTDNAGSDYKSIYDIPLQDKFFQEMVELYKKLMFREANAILFEGPIKSIKGYSVLVGISKHDSVSGKFAGALIVHADLTDYINYLKNFKVFGKSLIWVVDSQYNSLLSSDDNDLFSPSVLNKTITYNRDCVIGTDRKSLMNIVFGAPPEIFLSQLKSTIAVTAGVAFSVMVISTFIAYYLSKGFSRPIMELAKTSLAIGSGNLNAKAPAAQGEIGLLSQTLNKMAEDLKRTMVSRDYVDNILHSMNEGLFVLSSQAKIQTVNVSATKLLNTPEEELMGQPLGKLFKNGTHEDEIWFHNLMKNDLIRNEEKILVTKDDKEIPILFSCSVMKNDNAMPGIVCVAQDITEIKQAETALRDAFSRLKKTQEDLLMAERLAVVGETSGCVAHEVMNPITSIFSRIERNIAQWEVFNNNIEGFREIIADWQKEFSAGSFMAYMEKKDDDGKSYGAEDFFLLNKLIENSQAFKNQREDDLRFISKQLQRVIKIINSLRDSARTQRVVTKIDISKIIKESLEVLDDAFRKRGIEAKINFPLIVPLVLGDESEMIQVFNNLLRNAMQGIEKKEEHNGMVTLDILVTDGVIEIYLKDNGIGIPKAVQENIFNFNFTTKSRDQGTGLGLGISRRFIRECGGDIILKESVEGIGTTFLITIPIIPHPNLTTGV